ncbi:uncharacterized protein CDV56_106401 [Aspergillus thermomutatus]|uniref:Ecp2 effector protein-like domain-containing protein n=1 Tax=Aspergillus thermomutatus TaxID=41047 RepID=A0A397GIF5_ASPTH|nr:uncharacterized protein CDV56_106401 [Aspergillus thermomutatus]RHZ49226.1 hypothetical protein CDV56_106401 [Aspergillus thermomutatus]
MKLHAATVLATLIAVASAAPAPQTQNKNPAISALEKRFQVNDCGDSTFENQSSSGSPLVSDCQKIASNIASGGTWTVMSGTQHQLVQYGTCAFGVTFHYPVAQSVKIGNQDIIDLINTSISKFQWFDKVGAKGQMPCQTVSEGDEIVEWGIY